MSFSWGPLLISAVVSMAVTVTVVALVGFAVVAWSARSRPEEGRSSRLAAGAPVGTAVAAMCVAAVLAVLAYGLVVVIG